MTTLAVLLAAGGGTRFSAGDEARGHKLLALLRGRAVVDHSFAAMVAAGLDDCVVVTGAVDLADHVSGVAIAHNPRWASGQRSSLMVAVEHARARGHDAIVVGLADQPFVTADAWRRVADSDAPIAVASYGGRRGNPVRLHESVWPELDDPRADPDSGARSLMSRYPDLVRLVECEGSDADIDTVEDLQNLRTQNEDPTTWT